jgi:hypothetical protein
MLDDEVLTPIVRKILGRPEARITEWQAEPSKGDGSIGKRFVCRVAGRATAGDHEWAWSVFLKVPERTETHFDAWHQEAFQREPRLYAAGLLDELPGGIAAPRLLEVTNRPGDEPWMWLEDVDDLPALEWPLERFALTARHLGQMQGAFPADTALETAPWLDTTAWLRPRLAAGAERMRAALDKARAQSLAGRLLASPLGRRLERLWARRERIFDALEHMPSVLCHGDFNYTNLFSRPEADDADGTIAIDWQYAGVRQIGDDISGFIADSSIIPVRRKAAEPEEFIELMLPAWLAGLTDVGWKGDLRQARLAVLARLAWPWTFNLVCGLPGLEDRPDPQGAVDEYVRRQELLLSLADEAEQLL